MSDKPRCLFLSSSGDFEQTFAEPLLARLDSIVDVRRAEPAATPGLQDIQICVAWDDSPPIPGPVDNLGLIVHCGLTPGRVFPGLDMPSAWSDRPGQSDRPGPRAWDNAGLQRFSGGHWRSSTTATTITEAGPRLAIIAEPIERAMAEKLLAVVVMAACDPRFGEQDRHTEDGPSGMFAAFQRDFYDVNVGLVGSGGAATALCRLLRDYEVGLVVYDPDMTSQAAHEIGARLAPDFGDVARDADVVVIVPFKSSGRAAPGSELWSELPDGSGVVAQSPDLVDETSLAAFKGTVFVGLSDGGAAQFAGLPNVRLLSGLDGLLPNSLSRVGRYVVDVLHRYVEGSGLG